MGRSHFSEYGKQLKTIRDPVLELIQGRIAVNEHSIPQIATECGVSEPTMYRYLKTPSVEWKLGTIIKVCRCVGITTEELRERVRV